MMNSLFIRDLLRRTNADPLYKGRRDPHRLVMRDPEAKVGPGEVELRGVWRIEVEAPGDVPGLIRRDLAEFLARMGVSVTGEAGRKIVVRLGGQRPERDFCWNVSPELIEIEGGGVAGLWAGVTWLEWEMRTRRGPFLPLGPMERHAAWGLQISQGPWGGNYSVPDLGPEYLSDDALGLYAHYGLNSMMIYGDMLVYSHSELFPELDHPEADQHLATLAEASKRAARFGLGFTYVIVGPKLRPDHPLFIRLPEVRGSGNDYTRGPNVGENRVHCLCTGHPLVHQYYSEQFTRLFQAVPALRGLVFIVATESFYHCKMWRDEPPRVQRCERCWPTPSEEAVCQWISPIQQAVQAVKPDAFLAVWSYTNHGWERTDRRELFKTLPAGVVAMHNIDKDHVEQRDGYRKILWDYSVGFAGVSQSMVPVAEVAKEIGRGLLVKHETGIGLETFQFPYVPAMQHLAKRWEAVRSLDPQGVHQSWLFFGLYGSRAEELGLWAAYAPEMQAGAFLRRMAVRDFGAAAADIVLEAWQSMSAAIVRLPAMMLGQYYIGPSFLGPAHPLVPRSGQDIPDVFHGFLFYLQEAEETFSRKRIEEARVSLVLSELPPTAAAFGVEWDGPGDGWDIVQREYDAAAEEAMAAWHKIQEAGVLPMTPADRANLSEESLLIELVARTFQSIAHTLSFLRARKGFEAGDAAQLAVMRKTAMEERANAAAAIPIYTQTPGLDLAKRTDGYFKPCVEMIQAKLQWINAWLEETKP